MDGLLVSVQENRKSWEVMPCLLFHLLHFRAGQPFPGLEKGKLPTKRISETPFLTAWHEPEDGESPPFQSKL
jgi:hypothetical protein